MINFLKYTVWPVVKVRLTYWWWIVKYGGKKNIPRELIFGRISGSMERMRENLMRALRCMPGDTSEEDKKELLDLIRASDEMEKELEKSKAPWSIR
jgi:hypothetical protein